MGAAPLPPVPPTGLDPMGVAPDPMLGGLGVGSGAFPSTDPGSLAQIVQDALSQAAERDHLDLEAQQQQAALAAQPIIDEMMRQAAAGAASADPMQGMGADPMTAFGEGMGLPPMPPDELVA